MARGATGPGIRGNRHAAPRLRPTHRCLSGSGIPELAQDIIRTLIAAAAALLLAASVAQAQITLKSPSWNELSAHDQQVLAPLASDWNRLDTSQKQQWLGVAHRYSKMRPDAQQRIQAQMRSWAELSPEQRKAARARYKSLKSLPPDKKSEVAEKWREYQRLSPEQKRALAARNAAAKPGATRKAAPQAPTLPAPTFAPSPVPAGR
ncbi:MAG: DUF3106 domain-containing protein [Betaproteobacteria bacterium]|nr:DUF3106 domain-containing protein [Betaproteobacteria bacterium]